MFNVSGAVKVVVKTGPWFVERYQKKMLRLEKEEPSVRKRKLKERKFVFDMLEEEGLIKQSIGSLKL